MSKVTYTVYSEGNCNNVTARNLSLKDAAEALLTHDGYQFRFRREDGLHTVHVSQRSQNSYGGPGKMVPTLIFAATLDQLRDEIVRQSWNGAVAATDADYETLAMAGESEDE